MKKKSRTRRQTKARRLSAPARLRRALRALHRLERRGAIKRHGYELRNPHASRLQSSSDEKQLAQAVIGVSRSTLSLRSQES